MPEQVTITGKSLSKERIAVKFAAKKHGRAVKTNNAIPKIGIITV